MKKQIFLAALVVFSALLSFYFLRLGLSNLYFLIPGLLILPITWGLCAILIENASLVLITSLLVAALFLKFFGFSLPYLLLSLLILLSLLWGFNRAGKEKKLRIKILVGEIVPKAVSWLFFVLSIVLALGFYYSPRGQGLKEGIKIPTKMQEKIMSLATPGFSQNLTVDEMLNLLMKREKGEQVADKLRQEALKQLNLEDLNLTGREQISQRPEILDRLLSGKMNQILKEYAEYIPIVAAFIVWQVFLWLNKLLIPLVVLLNLILFALMKSTGFVQIKKVNVEKEEILL